MAWRLNNGYYQNSATGELLNIGQRPPAGELDSEIQQRNNTQRSDAINNVPDYLKKDLSRENPLPWQTYLPGELGQNGGLASDLWGKGLDPDYLKNQALSKVGSDSVGSSANSLGSSTGNVMSSAINKKYEAQTGNKLDSLKAKTEANAPIMQSNEMARAADIFGKDQAIAMQNFKEQYDYQQKRSAMYNAYENAKSQGEASMWGTIIGLGGTVAGSLIGGPVGGAVGGALGRTAASGLPGTTGGQIPQ